MRDPMKAKRHIAAFAAHTLAALAIFDEMESPVPGRVATAPVVVAAREIQEGRLIDRTAVTVAMWPVATIPAGAYSSVDSVVNRVAQINLFAGEALVPGRLAPHGTGAGLEVKVVPGKRAYSIRINDLSGIAGMVQPNSRVDVLVTMQPGGDWKSRITKIFIANVRVLAIGAHIQRGTDGRPINTHVATLEVTPWEIEKLAIAAAQGQISLALRGNGGPDTITAHGTTEAQVAVLLRNAPAYRAPPPAPRTARPPYIAGCVSVPDKPNIVRFIDSAQRAPRPVPPR